MGQKHHVSVDFKNAEGQVNANLVLISFKDEDAYIVYSPHLEVTGYGKTETEATESFNQSLRMFFDYTVNKKTLYDELMALGWELKVGTIKKPKKINAPSWGSLISRNGSLEEILNKPSITTTYQEVAFPV